jgi:hypothetical protein
MARFVGARVYDSANIVVATATSQTLTYDSERYDTDTIHSTVTNTGRLTCVTAGYYAIWANNYWAANATSYRQMNIMLNGATNIAVVRDETNTIAASPIMQCISTVYYLSATDYVTVVVRQETGGNLNITQASNYSPIFAMHRIG